MADKGRRAKEDATKRRLEAVAAIIGAVLALATIGIIVWDGATDAGRPALVSLTAGPITDYQDGFVLEVVALNSGDVTASEVLVVGTLRQDGEIVEASEVTFDYLPSRSERRGALYFSADPREHDLELRPQGYREP